MEPTCRDQVGSFRCFWLVRYSVQCYASAAMRTPQFIEDMPTQHRVGFALKCTAFVIMVAAVAVGHPPSRAQGIGARNAEDAKQDADITHHGEMISQQVATTAAMNLVIVQQGQDIARLDTKMSILFGILATVQGGGIVVTAVTKKR